eukprot:5557-Heterococcus_DN1.PRE.2
MQWPLAYARLPVSSNADSKLTRHSALMYYYCCLYDVHTQFVKRTGRELVAEQEGPGGREPVAFVQVTILIASYCHNMYFRNTP